MLLTCRQINSEASAIVQGIARRFILLQPPRLIFEAQDRFNERFFFWILDAISEQAHRRVLGDIWTHPRKIEQLLCSTQRSKILQFIDQAARQLAKSSHPCPPVHIVIGLHHVPYRTGERTRCSMIECKGEGAMSLIWSDDRSSMKSCRPFDLTAQYSEYLENDERSIPRALSPSQSQVGSTMTNISTQMSEAEWDEWLP